MIKLSELFKIETGKDLIYKNLPKGNIPIVGQGINNFGVTALTGPLKDYKLYPKNTITIAHIGNFYAAVRPIPCYIGTRVKVLIPKKHMTLNQKMFYCLCLNANKYRFNYGRVGSDKIPDILVPDLDEIPDFVGKTKLESYEDIDKPYNENVKKELNINNWAPFKLNDLFDIEIGKGPSLQFAKYNKGNTPYVTATAQNNGITAYVNYKATHNGNVITLNKDGSVGEAFYQSNDFCSSFHVFILSPKFNLNQYIAMFLITLLRKNKYRYNFGRALSLERMKEINMFLPVTEEDKPDYEFMEEYIKSLAYSKCL